MLQDILRLSCEAVRGLGLELALARIATGERQRFHNVAVNAVDATREVLDAVGSPQQRDRHAVGGHADHPVAGDRAVTAGCGPRRTICASPRAIADDDVNVFVKVDDVLGAVMAERELHAVVSARTMFQLTPSNGAT